MKRYRWVGFSWMMMGAAIALNVLNAIAPASAAPPEIAVTAPTAAVHLPQALLLGVVQGMTEFLPISSTAHLIAVSKLLGWGTPSVAFSAILELGSVAALVWYFWQDLVKIFGGTVEAFRTSNSRLQPFQLALGISLGTLPIILFGLLIKHLIPDFEHSPLRSLNSIAIASIIMAIVLAIAERLGKRQRGFDTLQATDGILMGLAQALSMIPGVSRSGSTLTAGLFMGLERATAARLSFLLGIPAISLAGLLGVVDVLDAGLGATELLTMLVGGITSVVCSYFAIGWLLTYLQTQTTWIFVWYRLAFGIALLAMGKLLPH